GDVADGRLALLPVDTGETKGPVGLTMRAYAVPSLPQSILIQIASLALRKARTKESDTVSIWFGRLETPLAIKKFSS
ncbi:hypothetical protein ACC760_40035, partial [Rhizobium ruizarguesonis]